MEVLETSVMPFNYAPITVFILTYLCPRFNFDRIDLLMCGVVYGCTRGSKWACYQATDSENLAVSGKPYLFKRGQSRGNPSVL